MKIFHKGFKNVQLLNKMLSRTFCVIYFDQIIPTDLSGDAPEKSLTLVAVSGGGGGPEDKVVRGRAGDRVDQRLQGLLEDVHFLKTETLARLLDWETRVEHCSGPRFRCSLMP